MPEGTVRRSPVVLGIFFVVAAAGLAAAPAAAQRTIPAHKPIAAPEPGPARVGTSMPFKLEPRLEDALPQGERHLWADLISVHGATFVKAHFVDVSLRKGDELVLRSATGDVVERITGRGPKELGTFWALSAFGEELMLELDFGAPYEKPPFHIDQVILGEPALLGQPMGPESICSPENFDDVFCYQGDSGKWANVIASVGIMTVGGNPVGSLWCSGSNISPSNYLLTNNHCITSQATCDSSEFVFRYYREGCNNGAPATTNWESFRCDDIVASSPIDPNCDANLAQLDYSLCSVLGDPSATFGYVTPDPVRLTDGEGIYILQHPAGRPHEIAHGSGSDVDVDGTTLRYYDTLDTEGGSSGSPIFRESDDKLVGLHHCGGCSTGGVGNRGMLMADIYPEIEEFLCVPGIEVAVLSATGLEPVEGDGDFIMEPGEKWRFTPRVRNVACADTALGVQAIVSVNAASAGKINLLQSVASFGDVPAGGSADALVPIEFRVRRSAPCGFAVAFDVASVTATNGGPFGGKLAVAGATIGAETLATVRYDGFSVTTGWSIVNGGAGAGPAATWTTANPGGRALPLTAPFFIVDSDEHGSGLLMNEELVSPAVNCAAHDSLFLQFTHDFNWNQFGHDEQADVDIRSNATGNAWVNIAKFQDGDVSGTHLVDITAQAAGQTNVQVRFHYYNAIFEFWWAVDDVFILGNLGYQCDVFGDPSPRSTVPLPRGNPVNR